MKIAVVTACTSTLPNYRLDMIKGFCRRGHEVVVFGDELEGKWVDYFSQISVSYRGYFVSRTSMNPLHDLRTKRELQNLFLEEGVDCVWTYQAKPNIYGCLAAHAAGVKRVYAMMGGTGSVFHSNDLKSSFARLIVSAEYRVAFKNVSKVFFQNTEDRDMFEKLRIVSREKVVLTRGSGVNLDYFKRKNMPLNPSFLFVGRLVRGKGVFEYLQAARFLKRRYPDTQFHLVGPFDANPTSLSSSQLQDYIDDGSIIFHGEQKDVRTFLENCSCFVLPSYYGEGTPKSALEAMATGRPLIVADAVGCREVVADGDNGFLVKPRSVEDLVNAMEKMIVSPDKANEMAERSFELAIERFDVNKVNDTICDAMGL